MKRRNNHRNINLRIIRDEMNYTICLENTFYQKLTPLEVESLHGLKSIEGVTSQRKHKAQVSFIWEVHKTLKNQRVTMLPILFESIDSKKYTPPILFMKQV